MRIFNDLRGKRKTIAAVGSIVLLIAGVLILFGGGAGAETGSFSGQLLSAAGKSLANFRDAISDTFLKDPKFLGEMPIGDAVSASPDVPNAPAARTAPSPAGRASSTTATRTPEKDGTIHHSAKTIAITEVCAGTAAGASDEFIELYNPNEDLVDLNGWTVKKIGSTGKESSLVAASRFEGKTIPPHRHFLIVNEGGYAGTIEPDARWARSSTLAYATNAIVVYDKEKERVAEVSWKELPKGQSIGRGTPDVTFRIQTPDPENSNDS